MLNILLILLYKMGICMPVEMFVVFGTRFYRQITLYCKSVFMGFNVKVTEI